MLPVGLATLTLILMLALLGSASVNQAVAAPSPSVVAAAPKPTGVAGDWTLALNSEFNTSSLDTTIWRPGWFGTGITNPINQNESACYRSQNVQSLGDGSLFLNVTPQPTRCEGGRRPYSGSIISSNPSDGRAGGGFQFRYGIVEVKVYLPSYGSLIANWPEVITLGQVWPKDGEDDIMEGLFGHACFHYHSAIDRSPSGLGGCDSDLRPGWHTLAADWEPGSITYYYDGVRVGGVTQGVASAPMYLVIANTVSKLAPQVARDDTMRLAYVRVWQRASA